MNVTFRQLRLFLALADTGSVSGAARAMHVTQPTASMQLREVARAVGMPLYEVVSRRVHLTDAGLELARAARDMVARWEAFGQTTDAMKGLARGRLRLAVVSTAKYFIPRMLGGFCERLPNVEIALEVQNRDGVIARLRDNLDDLYIMSRPPQDLELEDQVFLSNPLVEVAHAGHALSGAGPVALASLAAERFVLREKGSGTRLATDEHFRRMRFSPQVRLELGSNEAIREAVAGHLGVAVLSRHALGADPAQHGVVVLDVRGFPIQSRWHVVWPRGKQPSPIAQAFRAHLLAAADTAATIAPVGRGVARRRASVRRA